MANKKYLLAIRKNHNVIDPIEWNLFPNYQNHDINDLKTIDDFTTLISSDDLRGFLIESNMRTQSEVEKDFVIYHYENGAVRELIYGPCFKEDAKFLKVPAIIDYIKSQKEDKNTLNRIYNAFKQFNKNNGHTPAFKDFLTAINQFNLDEQLILNNLYYIDYIEQRSLGMFIAKNLVPKQETESIVKIQNSPTENKTFKKELTNNG